MLQDIGRKRMDIAKKSMRKNGIDVVIILEEDARNVQMLTGTTAFSALLLFENSAPVLLVHPIFERHAKSESWLPVNVYEETIPGIGDLFHETIAKYVKERTGGNPKIGYNRFTLKHDDYVSLRKEIEADFIDISETVLKDVFLRPFPEEIDVIKKLSVICDAGFQTAYETLEVGKTELEIATEIDYKVKSMGAEKCWFPTIVASGFRSSFPHGWTTQKVVQDGELVVIDIGPVYHGYGGDVCRTFVLGKKNKEYTKMHNAVCDALDNFLDKVREGVEARELDMLARQTIMEKGFTDYPHFTGHPIGNFFAPTFFKGSTDILLENMVFAVEPAVYTAHSGTRIEEHILVKKEGYELLTKFKRDPIIKL